MHKYEFVDCWEVYPILGNDDLKKKMKFDESR